MNIVFEVFRGSNPFTGEIYKEEITDNEVFEYCGFYWKDCNEETKAHIKEIFNL